MCRGCELTYELEQLCLKTDDPTKIGEFLNIIKNEGYYQPNVTNIPHIFRITTGSGKPADLSVG